MKHILMIYADEKAGDAIPRPEMEKWMAQMYAYQATLEKAGVFVQASGLARSHEATTVHLENGKLKVSADTSLAAKRVEELTAELRTVRHQQVFNKVAKAKGAREDGQGDLYRLSGYKPEADEASPAPVGKLLKETTSAPAVTPARARSTSSRRLTRRVVDSSWRPLSDTRSRSQAGSKHTRLRVQRVSSVIDSEPTAGRFRAASRLPQYLINAMLGCASAAPIMADIDSRIPSAKRRGF